MTDPMTSPDLTPAPASGEHDGLREAVEKLAQQYERIAEVTFPPSDAGRCQDIAYELRKLTAAHPVPSDTEEERECACGHDKTDHRDEVGCIVKVAPSNRVVSPFCRCLRFAAQPSVPAPAPERCPESWWPAAGGPGYQCVKPAGHAGAHDSALAPEEPPFVRTLAPGGVENEPLELDAEAQARIDAAQGDIDRSRAAAVASGGSYVVAATPAPAPEEEQREAPANLAPWLRDWRATPCEHSAPMRETCCAPCLRDRLLASDWLRDHDAQVRDNERRAWADWLSNWLGAVGPMPPTAEDVLTWLRHEQRPFGVSKNREAGEGR